jgi:nucleoside-diphosphate-sugar epimerase
MRILIIGGTKFIGPHVVRSLLEHGHEVTVLHRGMTESELPKCVRHIHDANAAIPVRTFPAEAIELHSDVVIHMIAMGEEDASRAIRSFEGRCGRMVWLSSGDVYCAYGRFLGIEEGRAEPGLLTETSPLRTVLFPYRNAAASTKDVNYFYEKILVEQIALQGRSSVILRLPKVYGPGGNQDLATMYRYRHQSAWRWTHGYVENVGNAIALAATHRRPVHGIYNVGEEYTPTVAQRLNFLPESNVQTDLESKLHFVHDIAFDTSRIRKELGFMECVSDEDGIERTLKCNMGK